MAPSLTPAEIRDIDWVVLSAGSNVYYMAMSGASYKNLAHNWNAMVVGVEERTKVATHYLGCIERHNLEANKEDVGSL